MNAPQPAGPDVGAPPDLVADVELADGMADLPNPGPDGVRRGRAWLLARLHTEPLGLVTVPLGDGLAAADIAAAVWRQCSEAITRRWPDADPGRLVSGAGPAGPTAFPAGRRAALDDGPAVTVVVCTRERPGPLRVCLDSLARQTYPRTRILVVDNAPTSAATAEVVAAHTGPHPVRRIVATTPGLSHARNRALAEVDTELVAWIDDDEIADRHWVTEVVRGFAERPDAAGMSGLVVPAEIATAAQAWYEAFGGHSKGRGFTPAVFDPGQMRQSPLYPLPPFGVGANMAFRTAALRDIGGFDPALGAGAPACGGEDTAIFTWLLLTGRTMLYRPSAVVRHFHRRDEAALHAQLHGYGVALTAFYASLLRRRPGLLWPLLGLAPTALRDVASPGSLRNVGVRDGMPPELMRANLRGMAVGPWRYVRGVLGGRRG
ncbi:glycosyltransferase family 2 protein [Pilimelia columellifera]|uniref:Glycosyltransferase 2-like domain-containing protein n=1 Tax=Pilimelia columellifera subsp. columellifera TaxID=706583 RepID=A0ABN3N355_9ACTN